MIGETLLDKLNRAGATLVRVDGKLRLQGSKIAEDLKTELRTHRAEVQEEFDRREKMDRDRYGKVPPPDAPMLARDLDLSEAWRRELLGYVMRQPRPVHAWVMLQASKYFEGGVGTDDCEWRACVDAVAWQRHCGGREAAEFVDGVAGVPGPTGEGRPPRPPEAPEKGLLI